MLLFGLGYPGHGSRSAPASIQSICAMVGFMQLRTYPTQKARQVEGRGKAMAGPIVLRRKEIRGYVLILG